VDVRRHNFAVKEGTGHLLGCNPLIFFDRSFDSSHGRVPARSRWRCSKLGGSPAPVDGGRMGDPLPGMSSC
jgi:hypothetical protein